MLKGGSYTKEKNGKVKLQSRTKTVSEEQKEQLAKKAKKAAPDKPTDKSGESS